VSAASRSPAGSDKDWRWRALFAERGVLFLDDTLSAVDPATEALLVASVRERRGGVVLVSHRLAHLTAFDRVLVLDGGRIVEDGAPAALAARPESRFSELLRAAAAEEQREPAHG
jgi:ABC-type multidrug transport system fused ATPase/permease subunit